jgi:hypothetical protein
MTPMENCRWVVSFMEFAPDCLFCRFTICSSVFGRGGRSHDDDDLIGSSLAPVPLDPNSVMAAPTPAASDPHRSRMRACRPAASDPDPLPAPYPLPWNPEPNVRRAWRAGHDFNLWRRRSYNGWLAIDHTTGQQRQTGRDQQRFCQI